MFLLPLQTPEKVFFSLCTPQKVFSPWLTVHRVFFFPFGLCRNCLVHCRKCFFHYRLSKNCFFNYKLCRNCFYLCLNVSTIKKKTTLQILFRPLRTLRKVCYHLNSTESVSSMIDSTKYFFFYKRLYIKCFFHYRLCKNCFFEYRLYIKCSIIHSDESIHFIVDYSEIVSSILNYAETLK